MVHKFANKTGPRVPREDEVYEYLLQHLSDTGKMPASLTQAAVDLEINCGTLHRILDRLVDDNRLMRIDPQMPYRIPSTK